MIPAPEKTVFDVLSDFLASNPSSEEILNYHLPEELQERASALIERNSEGLLSFDEELEMYDFIRADDMMSLIKLKTQLRLAGKNDGN